MKQKTTCTYFSVIQYLSLFIVHTSLTIIYLVLANTRHNTYSS